LSPRQLLGLRVSATVLLVAASTAWLGITANGLAAALVMSQLAVAPANALVVGSMLGHTIFVLLVIASGVLRERVPARSASKSIIIRSAVIAIWLTAPVMAVALWNLHAHRLDSFVVESFVEASAIIGIGLASVSLAAAGAARVRFGRAVAPEATD
jgi:hypothetical protein